MREFMIVIKDVRKNDLYVLQDATIFVLVSTSEHTISSNGAIACLVMGYFEGTFSMFFLLRLVFKTIDMHEVYQKGKVRGGRLG